MGSVRERYIYLSRSLQVLSTVIDNKQKQHDKNKRQFDITEQPENPLSRF